MPDLQTPPALDDEISITPLFHGPQRPVHLRGLLNRVTVGVALVLILASSVLWAPALRQAYVRLFPPPPYSGPVLYVVTYFGELSALRADTGDRLWQDTSADYEFASVFDHVVIATLRDSQGLRALDARSGRVLWEKHPVPGAYPASNSLVETKCAVDGLAIALVSYPSAPLSQHLDAYALSTGALRWSLKSSTTTTQQTTVADANCFGGQLFLDTTTTNSQSHDHIVDTLMRIDPATGQVIWQAASTTQLNSTFLDAVQNQLIVSAIAHNATPNVNPPTSIVKVFDAATGVLRWQQPIPSGSTFFCGDDVVIIGPASGNTGLDGAGQQQLTAFNIQSGKALWTLQGAFAGLPYVQTSQVFHSLAEVNATAILEGGQGMVGIDTATGLLHWWSHDKRTFVNPYISQAYLQGGQALYWLDHNGKLSALDIAHGTINWSTDLNPDQPRAIMGSDGQRIFVSTVHGQLAAVAVATGHMLWQQPLLGSVQVTESLV